MIFSLFFLKGYFNLMSRVTSLQVNPNLLGLFFFFNIEFLSRSRVHDFFTFLFKRLSQSHVWDYELHKLTRIYLHYFSFSFFLFLKSVTLRHCVSLKFEFYNFIQFFLRGYPHLMMRSQIWLANSGGLRSFFSFSFNFF